MACIRIFLSVMVLMFTVSDLGRGQTPPKRDLDCETTPEFSHQSIIFIMDKTTNLSAVDINTWKDAVNEVFSDTSIAGRVTTAEIEDTNVSFRSSSPMCVRALLSPPKPPLGALESQIDSHVPSTFNGKIHEIIFRFSSWIESLFAGTPSQAELDQELAAARLKMLYRDYVISQISSLADKRDKTDTSAIVGPIFQLIQAECSKRDRCKLFIFSDFIDTEIRRELIKDPKTPKELAGRTFNNYSKEYNIRLHSTTIDVVAWGIGRDEFGAPRPLRADLRRPLRIFWEDLLGRLCESAAPGSGIALTDKFAGVDSRSCR